MSRLKTLDQTLAKFFTGTGWQKHPNRRSYLWVPLLSTGLLLFFIWDASRRSGWWQYYLVIAFLFQTFYTWRFWYGLRGAK
jgi:hypothetical protein